MPVIMKTYGHIQIEKEALKLMKGQALMQIPGVDKEMSMSLKDHDKIQIEMFKKKLEDPNLKPSMRDAVEKMILFLQQPPDKRKIVVVDNEDES